MRAAGVRMDLAASIEDPVALEVGVLLGTCFPATAGGIRANPSDVAQIAKEGWRAARSRDRLIADVARAVSAAPDDAKPALRKLARREKLRIALREVLPRALGGADVDVTARELSYLADATIQGALDDAMAWARRRFGEAKRADGRDSTFVVIGMGKLGGEELNAGSDVDLIYFYDTDDGEVVGPEGSLSLHDFWVRVARRVTETLELPTEDGLVWRVDLRLRPEGGSGPLVNSLAAAERYYESFGRLWERAALLRARPVSGDLELGSTLLSNLAPFVWRRRIDPTIAVEMTSLVRRARAELSEDESRDLKLGRGGIREAEFFVQTLQLVWGGRDESLRVRPTLAALGRLETKGLCTTREASDISDAYLALRRAEHAAQVGSGLQTHLLPRGKDLVRLSRALGFPNEDAFLTDLARHKRRVETRMLSLLPTDSTLADETWAPILGAIERGDEATLQHLVAPLCTSWGYEGDDEHHAFAKHLLELGRHPDALLGLRTRDAFPGLSETLLDALADAPDPLQCARYLRFFFARVRQPAVYVRLAFADPAALRRLVAIVGSSAFVGDSLCNNPELGDVILFTRSSPSPKGIEKDVRSLAMAGARPDEDPDEALVGTLRAAKTRFTLEVALADLSGDFGVREVNRALTALADASLEVATERALGSSRVRGFAVIAMGKLGGREISYGSDLDVLFVYDPSAAKDDADPGAWFTRAARKVIRYISTFHGAGPGYELDTRLRPSGNQGLLVTTLEAFSRYHGLAGENPPPRASRAAVWERMALTRARFAAGDPELGAKFVAIAREAAFGEPPTEEDAHELARIRARVAREASEERPGVYDIKLGRGALFEIELVAQFLSIAHAGALASRERTSETLVALEALRDVGALPPDRAATLIEAYGFLRRLELRVRIVRADGAHLLDERSSFLQPLARRMGLRDHPTRSAGEALKETYRALTSRVRSIFDETFGGCTENAPMDSRRPPV
ncbi:MAG: bifunctional [glutamate--ammonia ligase]-adenylyl-L-tyrosine phosphorylase/[glutamate--ammonia-ligase] adenylyltransferase [Polyangiaceae bacterium]|nr:bifunctional [glutamate--ammonia ligase]-adenylyl-L-tyrosine phosphorylase/[glutamate--ammonia-ligase] adenylyltransferase [Polyangiaceae bacterium]